jgi:hypothetical protein
MILEKILVKVNADSEIKEEFSECFSDRAELVFLDDIIMLRYRRYRYGRFIWCNIWKNSK